MGTSPSMDDKGHCAVLCLVASSLESAKSHDDRRALSLRAMNLLNIGAEELYTLSGPQRFAIAAPFHYVQGAGDDEEAWAVGLTAERFWQNAGRLLACQSGLSVGLEAIVTVRV
eukprot:Selendium_serpulae@DN125_c0_g1_i1.p3